MHSVSRHVLFLSCFVVPLPASAACVASSGSQRPALVELYTSEGCSSCPPAERWLSSLRDSPGYVGLEFHVDYWNVGDWRDPYSDARFSARQKQLGKRATRGVIYTPQVALDGAIWKDWPRGKPPSPNASAGPALSLRVEGSSTLRVHVESSGGDDADRLHVALTQNGLSNPVHGGENRGKTLAHDQVVRAFSGPFPLGTVDTDLAIPADVVLADSRIVAFVQSEKDGSVSQVLPLPLQGCAPP